MKTLPDIMRDFITRVLGEQSFYSERARVTAVDLETNTCTVKTLNDKSEIFSVIINAYRGALYGVFPVPKVGSVVTISYYERNEAYVAKMGELEQLKVVFQTTDETAGVTIDIINEKLLISWPDSDEEESTTIEVSELEILFNGGNLLGLVKIQELTDRLNELESLWNKLQMDFNTWVPVVNDGGLALKTQLLSSFLLELVPDSQVEDFENEKIKQ
jgi:hypothetical protein